jgi:hypothetical protein
MTNVRFETLTSTIKVEMKRACIKKTLLNREATEIKIKTPVGELGSH